MKLSYIIAAVLFTVGLSSCGDDDESNKGLTDIDGNSYNTVVIGTQEWMAENLRVSKTSAGVSLTNVEDDGEWGELLNANFEVAYKTNDNVGLYGFWYSYAAATIACPAGWHLPSDDDWKELEMNMGMSANIADNADWRGTNEGMKLKASSGWDMDAPDSLMLNGTDSVGFAAVPGGYCGWTSGSTFLLNRAGLYWSSTLYYDENKAWIRKFEDIEKGIKRIGISSSAGFSVRCVRDLYVE